MKKVLPPTISLSNDILLISSVRAINKERGVDMEVEIVVEVNMDVEVKQRSIKKSIGYDIRPVTGILNPRGIPYH